jgi:hypothetical protein
VSPLGFLTSHEYPVNDLVLRSVREFVPPGAILPWDLALLAEKQR